MAYIDTKEMNTRNPTRGRRKKAAAKVRNLWVAPSFNPTVYSVYWSDNPTGSNDATLLKLDTTLKDALREALVLKFEEDSYSVFDPALKANFATRWKQLALEESCTTPLEKHMKKAYRKASNRNYKPDNSHPAMAHQGAVLQVFPTHRADPVRDPTRRTETTTMRGVAAMAEETSTPRRARTMAWKTSPCRRTTPLLRTGCMSYPVLRLELPVRQAGVEKLRRHGLGGEERLLLQAHGQ